MVSDHKAARCRLLLMVRDRAVMNQVSSNRFVSFFGRDICVFGDGTCTYKVHVSNIVQFITAVEC